MAIIFSLWVECADDGKSSGAMAGHFTGLSHRLISGLEVRWEVEAGPSAVSIWSRAFPWDGIGSVQNAADMSEAGTHLLLHLNTAPDFVMSRIGIEADNSSFREFLADSKEDPMRVEEGMVLSREAWKSLGRPKYLRVYRAGYAWNPWLGQRLYPSALPQYQPIDKMMEKLPRWTNSEPWTDGG